MYSLCCSIDLVSQWENYYLKNCTMLNKVNWTALTLTLFSIVQCFRWSFVFTKNAAEQQEALPEYMKAAPFFDSPRRTAAGPRCWAVVGGCLCVLVLVTFWWVSLKDSLCSSLICGCGGKFSFGIWTHAGLKASQSTLHQWVRSAHSHFSQRTPHTHTHRHIHSDTL